MYNPMMVEMLWSATKETLFMVGVAAIVAEILGLPIGILLVTSDEDHILECKWLHKILGLVVNVGRSVPFIILMVAIIPFTRWVVGTSIGTTAAIVPLVVAAIPFVARVVETSLKEVDSGVIEAAQAMGASPWEIIVKVLIPESLPGLIRGFTLTAVNLVGYSAMAGTIGGGGLGDLAIRFGYQRFRGDVMLYTVIILVLIVQVLEISGNLVAQKLSRR